MKEIGWNGGYYREGGTIIYNDQIKIINKLEVEIIQNRGIFDRQQILKITTRDGKVIESLLHC